MNSSNVGVALTRCFFCNEGDAILLNQRLTPSAAAQVESMHNKVINMEPCNKCRDLMKEGVILITIDEEKSGDGWNKPPSDPDDRKGWMPNPYRTGGWFVVRDDAIRRMFQPEDMANWALRNRWMFIAHEAAKLMGLFDVTPERTEA